MIEIYTNKKCNKCVKKGTYKGIKFYILSYWTHPCAYVLIDKKSKLYEINYHYINDIINDCVNWWFTYSEYWLWKYVDKEYWVLWWDYAHSWDYFWWYNPLVGWEIHWKKWTVEEILEQIHDCIDKIQEFNEDIESWL